MDKLIDKLTERIFKGVQPDKIILFGSHARGDYTGESDYDICVIKSGVEHKRKLARSIIECFTVLVYRLIL